jgi:hypothetical protein
VLDRPGPNKRLTREHPCEWWQSEHYGAGKCTLGEVEKHYSCGNSFYCGVMVNESWQSRFDKAGCAIYRAYLKGQAGEKSKIDKDA